MAGSLKAFKMASVPGARVAPSSACRANDLSHVHQSINSVHTTFISSSTLRVRPWETAAHRQHSSLAVKRSIYRPLMNISNLSAILLVGSTHLPVICAEGTISTVMSSPLPPSGSPQRRPKAPGTAGNTCVRGKSSLNTLLLVLRTWAPSTC